MANFPINTIETAPEAAQSLMQGVQDKIGFVPNLYGKMSNAPSLLEAYLTLSQITTKVDLSETERQVVFMTNNRLNGCTYCMAAHTGISKGAKVPEDVIESLRTGSAIADPKLEALRQYAMVVNESRGWPSEADQQALLDAGYTEQTMLEVVLLTGLKVLSNYTNHIAQTPTDDAFKPFEWSDAQSAAA